MMFQGFHASRAIGAKTDAALVKCIMQVSIQIKIFATKSHVAPKVWLDVVTIRISPHKRKKYGWLMRLV